MSLEIINLSTAAFRNLSLVLPSNGLYGIIGRNGAGKTTLFTSLSGELKPEAGTIKISGEGRAVYVPNLDIFDKNLTADDYVALLRGQERQKAEKLKEIFHANKFFGRPIRKYSLGMKEILAFIYSLSLNSDLLIIDELMNGLDHSMREAAFQLLKAEAESKVVLLTSHILEEVEKYCNTVYFLAKEGFSEVSDFEEARKLVQEAEVFI